MLLFALYANDFIDQAKYFRRIDNVSITKQMVYSCSAFFVADSILRIWEYTAGWFEDLRPGEFCGQ
jgi:hypothetical protein